MRQDLRSAAVDRRARPTEARVSALPFVRPRRAPTVQLQCSDQSQVISREPGPNTIANGYVHSCSPPRMLGMCVYGSAESASLLSGLHVLVVDDDRIAREALAATLEFLGAVVTAVVSAADARRALEQIRPHAI